MASKKQDNMELWNSVFETPPDQTKNFKRGGGFSGTAISPMYMIKRATEIWGPIGDRWGIEVIDQIVYEGAPMFKDGMPCGNERVFVARCRLWFPAADGDGAAFVTNYGQTMLVSQFKSGGIFTDEEAPKKALTDAMTKALSQLGFAGDVHMGMFDDSKYVNDLRRKFDTGEVPESQKAPMAEWRDDVLTKVKNAKGLEDLKTLWKKEEANFNKAKTDDEASAKMVKQAVEARVEALKDEQDQEAIRGDKAADEADNPSLENR